MAPLCTFSTQNAQKCMKPGRVTRNGYLNFLRDFRKSNCGLSAVETVIKGAEKWRKMSPKEKTKYMELAKNTPKTQNAQKCMKPGRVTRNGYFNFLRDFRKSNCGLSAVETVRKGAEKWRKMSPRDKSKYMALAKNTPKTPRRSRLRGRSMRSGRARMGRARRRR